MMTCKQMLTAGGIVLGLAGAVPALAAPPAQQPPAQPQQQAPQNTHVSKAELHKFAKAYQDEVKLRSKYVKQLKSTKNKKKAQKIAMQANNKIKAKIKNDGLSLKEYSRVANAVVKNPKLNRQLRAILKKGNGS
jgi:beta-glucosidase/6-phospho-beta-glucosidase/beta-galactosidase